MSGHSKSMAQMLGEGKDLSKLPGFDQTLATRTRLRRSIRRSETRRHL